MARPARALRFKIFKGPIRIWVFEFASNFGFRVSSFELARHSSPATERTHPNSYTVFSRHTSMGISCFRDINRMKLPVALLILGVGANAGLSAEKALEWPRFRGPNGSGVAESAKPPIEFGPDKNLKWKISVPGGLSSPIIAKDQIVIT